jgi:hypothetical protein
MRRTLALGVALALGLAAHVMDERVLARRADAPAAIVVLYVPPASYLQWMAVGYREALADLLWVRALIYSGEHLKDTDIAAVDRYVDAINTLAPRFRRPYVWGGITSVYNGQAKVTREMVDGAIAIYRRGLVQFPESHELLYPFGMLLLHQAPSTPGYSKAELEAMRAEGIESLR